MVAVEGEYNLICFKSVSYFPGIKKKKNVFFNCYSQTYKKDDDIPLSGSPEIDSDQCLIIVNEN